MQAITIYVMLDELPEFGCAFECRRSTIGDGAHQKPHTRSRALVAKNVTFNAYLSMCQIIYLIRKDSDSCNRIYFAIKS